MDTPLGSHARYLFLPAEVPLHQAQPHLSRLWRLIFILSLLPTRKIFKCFGSKQLVTTGQQCVFASDKIFPRIPRSPLNTGKAKVELADHTDLWPSQHILLASNPLRSPELLLAASEPLSSSRNPVSVPVFPVVKSLSCA